MATFSLTVATRASQKGLLAVESTSSVAAIAPDLETGVGIRRVEQALTINGAPLRPEQTLAFAIVAGGDLFLVERVERTSRLAAMTPAEQALKAARDGPLNTRRTEPALLARTHQHPQPQDTNVTRKAGRIKENMAELSCSSAPAIFRRSSKPAASAAAASAIGGDTVVVARSGHRSPCSRHNRCAAGGATSDVRKNHRQALERNPESFAVVAMLYVDVKVNGHATTAFVDSGAQRTIISVACARRCGLHHLLDTRFSGTARGIGTATIFGRIHCSLLELADQFFYVSFMYVTPINPLVGKVDSSVRVERKRMSERRQDVLVRSDIL